MKLKFVLSALLSAALITGCVSHKSKPVPAPVFSPIPQKLGQHHATNAVPAVAPVATPKVVTKAPVKHPFDRFIYEVLTVMGVFCFVAAVVYFWKYIYAKISLSPELQAAWKWIYTPFVKAWNWAVSLFTKKAPAPQVTSPATIAIVLNNGPTPNEAPPAPHLPTPEVVHAPFKMPPSPVK